MGAGTEAANETSDALACLGDPASFDAGFGPCPEYQQGRQSSEFCDEDRDGATGLFAYQVCEECLKCTKPYASTAGGSAASTTEGSVVPLGQEEPRQGMGIVAGVMFAAAVLTLSAGAFFAFIFVRARLARRRAGAGQDGGAGPRSTPDEEAAGRRARAKAGGGGQVAGSSGPRAGTPTSHRTETRTASAAQLATSTSRAGTPEVYMVTPPIGKAAVSSGRAGTLEVSMTGALKLPHELPLGASPRTPGGSPGLVPQL